jgi:hypothetical protein
VAEKRAPKLVLKIKLAVKLSVDVKPGVDVWAYTKRNSSERNPGLLVSCGNVMLCQSLLMISFILDFP